MSIFHRDNFPKSGKTIKLFRLTFLLSIFQCFPRFVFSLTAHFRLFVNRPEEESTRFVHAPRLFFLVNSRQFGNYRQQHENQGIITQLEHQRIAKQK